MKKKDLNRIIGVLTGVPSGSNRRARSRCDTAHYPKFGFTLAEVLITLGIIGIVAAMTMPALIGKYRNYVLKNQFKRTFAILQTGLMKAVYDNGGDIDCKYYNNSEYGFGEVCRQFYLNNFFKALNAVKICTGSAYANGCVPEYGVNVLTGGNAGCSGYNLTGSGMAAVLSDGSIIIPYFYTRPLFIFDTNGKKGPNLPGYDVFSVKISQYGTKYTILDAKDNSDAIFACLSGIKSDAPLINITNVYK